MRKSRCPIHLTFSTFSGLISDVPKSADVASSEGGTPEARRGRAVNELMYTDSLMEHLRKGAPLDLEAERVRLPRFTEIRECSPAEFGQKGKEPFVLARCRTATWAIVPVSKRGSFDTKDADAFLKLVQSVADQNPGKPVKGYVITSGPIANDSKVKIAAAGHVVSAFVATA